MPAACWPSGSPRSAATSVLVIDKRHHIGGNAYDRPTRRRLLIHQYGPHIFHTNSQRSSSTSRSSPSGALRAPGARKVDGQLLPIPINLDTVNRLYGLHPRRGRGARTSSPRAPSRVNQIRTSEDVVVVTRRPRALREVLPRLHAQAVGGRSLAARRVRDGARAGAHQSRRPLFHRHLPVHAAARLHRGCSSACSITPISR